MRWVRWCFVAVLSAPLVGLAKPPSMAPPKGCWEALVRPGARWVLEDTVGEGEERLTLIVETRDVRVVGPARVARLRWSSLDAKKKLQPAAIWEPVPEQVALTDKGIWFLAADLDDTQVLAALRGKPTYGDPPKGRPAGRGDYVVAWNTTKGPMVCVGSGPGPGDGPCEDICYGEMCVSPTDGIVGLEANWAPGQGLFRQAGYGTDDLRASDSPPASECKASSDCSGASLCFQHRCVARKAIQCPSKGVACPPNYWRMFWYLDKLCHDRFTPDMMGLLRAGRPKGESTQRDIAYLAAFADALKGADLRDADIRQFYYSAQASTWLPHPCSESLRKWQGKPLPQSMQRWQKDLLELQKVP